MGQCRRVLNELYLKFSTDEMQKRNACKNNEEKAMRKIQTDSDDHCYTVAVL